MRLAAGLRPEPLHSVLADPLGELREKDVEGGKRKQGLKRKEGEEKRKERVEDRGDGRARLNLIVKTCVYNWKQQPA